jgi:polysaccharide biosynthesis protein PslH
VRIVSMGCRPNLLFLAHRAPYPPDRGDRIRSFHILRHLSQRFRVYLGAVVDEPITAETVQALKEVSAAQALVPLSRYGRWAQATWTMARGQSATEGLFRSSALRRQVRAWARDVQFDAIFAFCSSMVQYADAPELKSVPLVVDLVDVDSQKWLDYAAGARSWKRALFKLEAGRVRQVERSLPTRSKAITLVSEAEADLYRSFCPNEKTHAVMNGVNLGYFRPDFAIKRRRPDQCVFVGVLDYRANVESLVWFCREVWPRVLSRKPDAVFSIVGKNPSPSVRLLGQQLGVRLVGPVSDVRQYIAESRFVIAPLLVARGIQNKVLEAMAMGKPVLATPQALEGLVLSPGIHALSADRPEDWVKEIDRLYGDDRLCDDIGTSGRCYVERHHAWSACLSSLDALLDNQEPLPPAHATCVPADVVGAI